MKLGINVVRLTRPFTGVGRYVECLLRHWARRGTPFDEVILYAPKPIRTDLAQVPLEPFTVRLVGRPCSDPLWETVWLGRAARDADVLFCPSYTAPLRCQTPYAVSYLGPAVHEGLGYAAFRGAVYDRLHRQAVRQAAHVFVCSEAVKTRVTEQFGAPDDRVSTTYLAASDLFVPVPDGPERLEIVKRHIRSDAPYLLYVGKLSGRHFIPELLEGFAAAARSPDFGHNLVLAGPDTLGYDVPSFAARLGLPDRIQWIPFVPHHELPALYSAASAFVFPACEAEGFGIPVLEAMACGTPVISVDQGSISEFAREAALLVPEPERHQLAGAMVRLVRDADLARAPSQQGARDRATDHLGLHGRQDHGQAVGARKRPEAAVNGARDLSRQTPTWLSRFEDPWGIVWRTSNLARRVSFTRTARFAAALLQRQSFDRPLFILGAPRSGTTMVFRWLAGAPGFGALPREGHDLWRAYHHPRYTGWGSDAVGAGRLGLGERRFAGAFLRSYFSERRFVEKTPENSLRVPYLLDLFPDARFLVVRRDPLATIRSMIAGWRDPHGRFRSYYVPEDLTIPGYPHRRQWCFALIEGWRDLKAEPIPNIAAAQWKTCAAALTAARESVGQQIWMEIRLEDLLENPAKVAGDVYRFAGIDPDAGIAAKLAHLVRNPVYASASQPSDDEVQLVAPSLAGLCEQTGYRLSKEADRWVAKRR